MARAIRADTLERIQIARDNAPLSMGPLFGQLATEMNVSASIVASITKAHEQTVLRWFFGQSEMQPQWIKASLKLFGLLVWMRAQQIPPLTGDTNARISELVKYRKQFDQLADPAS